MIWTIFSILIGCWLFGVLSAVTLGGTINLLLIVAFFVLVMGMFQGPTRTQL